MQNACIAEIVKQVELMLEEFNFLSAVVFAVFLTHTHIQYSKYISK